METTRMVVVLWLLTIAFVGCRSTAPFFPLKATPPATAASKAARQAEVQRVTARQPLTAPDTAVRWGGQKLCPVTGEPLGSMGDAISVPVNGKTIWVCCEGCLAAVKRNPQEHLKRVEDELGWPAEPAGPGDRSSVRSNSSRFAPTSGACQAGSSCRSCQ